MPDSTTHILYVAEFSTGGSVESLLCLVGGLDKQAFRATVLFYKMPSPLVCERFESAGATIVALYPQSSDKGGIKQLQKLNLQSRVQRLFGRRIESLYYSFKFAVHFLRFRWPIYRAIRHQIGLIKPDLVHLNNGARTDTAGILAARAHDIPSVGHVRTFGKVSSLGVIAVRSVKVFLCISNAVRDQLVEYGIETSRCVVVPNSVDATRFDESDSNTPDIRSEFGWDRSDTVFALIGRIVAWKGQDFFIQAVYEARNSDRTIRGLIVGNDDGASGKDDYFSRLKSLVIELELEDSVRFAGHRTDIPGIMKSADGVVCPSSLPEPFGRVIIESMAVGTPTIATAAGGAMDIISDAENGLLVPVKDSSALAGALLRLTPDADLPRKLSAAATQTVANRYTVKRHVDRVCDIYRTVLEQQQKDANT